MNNNLYEDDEIEIDLREIFFAVKKWFWVIAAAGLLGGLLALLITKLFMTPMYTAENSMLVLAKDTTLTSLSDLQMGSQLTSDYEVLITCRPVLEEVILLLGLDMDYEDLKKKIEIEIPSDARILVMKVEHESPELALSIVRELAKESSRYIGNVMEVAKPKIIDDGALPLEPSSPSTLKNVMIGILAAAFLVGGAVVLKTVLDDTIKSEEDIEKYLGLPTLSSIPDRKDYISKGKEKKGFFERLSGKTDLKKV